MSDYNSSDSEYESDYEPQYLTKDDIAQDHLEPTALIDQPIADEYHADAKVLSLLKLIDPRRFSRQSPDDPSKCDFFTICLVVKKCYDLHEMVALKTLVSACEIHGTTPKDLFESAFTWKAKAKKDLNDKVLHKWAKAYNPVDYKKWIDQYVKHKEDKEVHDTTYEEEFNTTFSSERIKKSLCSFIKCKDISYDRFKEILCDESYAEEEFMYWCNDYIVICNDLMNDTFIQYSEFTKFIKTIRFGSYRLLQRFSAYFINECFIMFADDGKYCYYRREATKEHPEPVDRYAISNFEMIDVNFYADDKLLKNNLKCVLKSIPFHQFNNIVYEWGKTPKDKHTIAMSTPFRYNLLDREITEEDLPENVLYYFKSIICDDSQEEWEWLRMYLATIIFNPNMKTRIMLVLYSKENQCGKSVLYHNILNKILTNANATYAKNLKDVFGIRGCPQAVGKKLIWLEEMSKTTEEFKSIMDNMKSSITDNMTTSRALYKECIQYKNTHEYIAATNYSISILKERMTVFNVSDRHQNDKSFYGPLTDTLEKEGVLDLIVSYLYKYKSDKPINPLITKIHKIMLKGSQNPFECYMDQLKYADNYYLTLTQYKNDLVYATTDDVYTSYKKFCDKDHYKITSKTTFTTNITRCKNIEKKRINTDNGRKEVFTFMKEFFEEYQW